ncbi:MAG: cobalt ECF transporter T component CbiQ [Spirochaetaceae bacterium]|nr:cobalt ECF transporter T component CbiQ [Spirochaetaceae bacterium]
MAALHRAAAGISRLEALALGDSPVHRLHPLAKVLVTLAYMTAVISFPPGNVSGLAVFLAYPLVLLPASGTPPGPLAGRLLCALPFALMGGLSNLLLMRETAFHIGSFAVSSGLVSFTSLMLKTLLTVCAVLLLAATTSFTDIAAQLAALRVPRIFCLQLIMTYRYIGVLLHEAASMTRAYLLRAACRRGIRIKDMGSFLAQLIVRSFDRAARVYRAMTSRGFTGVYRGGQNAGFRLRDGIYVAALGAVFVFLRFFNVSLFLAGRAGSL